MAFRNQELTNPVTGQRFRFLQTAADTQGAFLEMETTYPAHSPEPPVHYHPYQDEYFSVLAGTLSIRLKNTLSVLKAGERIHLPPNTLHSMWNSGNEETVVHWIVKPAFQTEYLLETLTKLAAESKTNTMGKPGLLQGIIMNTFADEFRLAKPPYRFQKIFFALLDGVAWLLGKKRDYQKNIVDNERYHTNKNRG